MDDSSNTLVTTAADCGDNTSALLQRLYDGELEEMENNRKRHEELIQTYSSGTRSSIASKFTVFNQIGDNNENPIQQQVIA